jgi:hypothetical protein
MIEGLCKETLGYISLLEAGGDMTAKIIPFLVMAMAFVTTDVALARDVNARNRGGQSMRTTPSLKVPRTRAAPRNVVPVYPGMDRSTLGLEYNQQLRLRINPIPPYVPIR